MRTQSESLKRSRMDNFAAQCLDAVLDRQRSPAERQQAALRKASPRVYFRPPPPLQRENVISPGAAATAGAEERSLILWLAANGASAEDIAIRLGRPIEFVSSILKEKARG